jgi:hypothetical protein
MVSEQAWLDGFAARLLQLKPEMSPIEAKRIASVQIKSAPHLDPKVAAELYASKSPANA